MSDSENNGPVNEKPTDGEPVEGKPPETPTPADPDAEAKAEAEAARAKAEAAAKPKTAREAAEAAKPPWLKDPTTPEWEDASDDPLVEALQEDHPEAILAAATYAGDLVLTVQLGGLEGVAGDLKRKHGYRQLVDNFGAHFPDREETPLEVVYIVYNHETNRRARLKVKLGEGVEVPTLTGVWKGVDWTERETWDMYGIRFAGHPDMTRILLWEGFNGHPLRKEFPVEGIDTGAAIYPEYYGDEAGPVAGTGTGWKAPGPETDETGDEAGGTDG